MISLDRPPRLASRAARILLVSPDMLPLGGRAASGAGLRAFGLGQGLAAWGHEVTFALPRATAAAAHFVPQTEAPRVAEAPRVVVFDDGQLDALVARHQSDLVLFQHWPLVNLLADRHVRVAIDFHGPLLLETLFHSGREVTGLYAQKLRALARADFFTCAGERQRNYFYAWLQLAGFDLRQLPIEVVPFAWSPEPAPHEHYPAEPRFVFGGMFLPWQNPLLGLRALVEELDRAGTGRLDFFGGKHPRMQFEAPEFDEVLDLLHRSPRATVHPLVPRAELLAHYSRASVAWDLMSHNCERGMAITSRTVEYLWAGLPVVYQRYAELAGDIAEFQAGWLVDPENSGDIRRVIQEILSQPEEIVRRGANAQRLVRERRNWTLAAAPLAEYAANPRPAARLAAGPLLHESLALAARRQTWERLKRLARVHPWTDRLARGGWHVTRRAVERLRQAAPVSRPRLATAVGPAPLAKASVPPA